MPLKTVALLFMMKIYIRNVIIALVFLVTLTSAIMNVSGPAASNTNAPGTGEGNCTSCHIGTLITSGTDYNKIFLNTGFQGGGYVPDSTYTIALSFKQAGIARYGFQITCLTSNGNIPVGTFDTIGGRVQKTTAVISGNTRQYIGHTGAGSDTVKKDSTRWIFKWKAPGNNVGKIKFYVCVNASNNNGGNDGDVIYAKVFEFGPSPLLPVAKAYSIDSNTCTNYNVQMTGKGTNSPTSFQWKFINATLTTSILQNPIIKFTSTSTSLAILTVKNALGTSFPDTLKFTVKASPNATILSGTSGIICKGDSIQLTANNASGLSHKWNPVNKTGFRTYIKDSGIYNVTVTSANLCATTSANYKLNWYTKPTIAIGRNTSKDSFCGQINETFTASGIALDSIHWYVNNQLFMRTGKIPLIFKANTNSTIYAIGKSLNNCFSLPSNTFNLKIVPKIYPLNFSNTKSTSDINVKWQKTKGIDSLHYSINSINFKKTTSDTTLALSALAPSTFYNITIRSFQKGVCPFSDTILSIRTNNCSNLVYNIVLNSKLCRGEVLTAFVKDLPKSQVSVSFNNLLFSNDTSYSFNPVKSDSLQIFIKDSLSLTCPPINEKLAYIVDTFAIDNGIYTFNVSSCENNYNYAINPLYQKYEFYKNNILISTGNKNQFKYTNLVTGDKLSVKVSSNSCSKIIGIVSFTRSPPADATFTLSRNWKTYTFKPNDSTAVNYEWYINDTLISNSKNLVKDMSPYNKKTAKLKLKTVNFQTCSDSAEQIINFPDFLSVANLSNYQLNIFPNPFNEQVEIVTNLDYYNLDVYDNLGRNVLHLQDLNLNKTLNTDDWQNGLYHIVLSNKNLKLDRILIKVQ